MEKLQALGLHLSVLLVVLGFARSAPAGNSSEVLPNPDYYDDDIFTPPDRENFDVFDWRLCREIAARELGNIVVSPISVKLVLAMLYEGAAGNSAKELERTLQLPASRLDSRRKYSAILNSLLAKQSEFVLDVGTKMYVQDKVNLRPRFSKILQAFYNTDIQKMDFTEPTKAVQTINSWINNATQGRIKSMFNEDTVSASTVMLLVNAIYFKGLWRYSFNESDTKEGKFQVTPNQKVTVPFMTMERDLYFSQSVELDSSIVRLPYLGDKYSMFIVLPRKADGLNKLLDTVIPSLLRNQLFHMEKIPVNIKLPKFTFDYTTELETTLKALGLSDIFNENAADLPGLVRGSNLYVSKFFQKAGLEVNEQGTTAFASTGMTLSNKFGGDDAVNFHATHPFMFFIQNEKTGTVIFVGKLMNPSTEKMSLRHHVQQSVTDTEQEPGQLHSRLGTENAVPQRQASQQGPFIAIPAHIGVSYNDVIDHNLSADTSIIPLKTWAYLNHQFLRQQKNYE